MKQASLERLQDLGRYGAEQAGHKPGRWRVWHRHWPISMTLDCQVCRMCVWLEQPNDRCNCHTGWTLYGPALSERCPGPFREEAEREFRRMKSRKKKTLRRPKKVIDSRDRMRDN